MWGRNNNNNNNYSNSFREKQERERQERERKERERQEWEKKERERQEWERQEHARLEQERQELERQEKERQDKEKQEREEQEKERQEKEKQERERQEKERQEQEQMKQERQERERLEKERLETERLEKEKQEKERQEREREQQEKAKGKKKNGAQASQASLPNLANGGPETRASHATESSSHLRPGSVQTPETATDTAAPSDGGPLRNNTQGNAKTFNSTPTSGSGPQLSHTTDPRASVLNPSPIITTQSTGPHRNGSASLRTPVVESPSPLNASTMSSNPSNAKQESAPPPSYQNNSTPKPLSSQLPNGSALNGVNQSSSTISNPKKQKLLVMHDTTKRTTTVDWYIKVPVDSDGIAQEYQATTSLSSDDAGSGKITWKTDVSNPEDPLSTITIGISARLDLRVYSTTTFSSAIIDRYVDGYKESAPTVTIPWHDLKGLVGKTNVLELLVSIIVNDAQSPLPSAPIITETCSPSAIEALGGFLDQPGGHDVVFQFPGRTNYLYGDRYILQRSSEYFRSRFQVGEDAPASTPSRKKLDADSDDEFEGEDEEDRVGVDSSAPNGAGANHSPQSRFAKKTRSYSTSASNITQSKIDFHGIPAFRLEPVPQYPPYNVGVSVTQTNEISYRTFRALLYYIYTGYIAFAPITSNVTLPENSDLSAEESQEKRKVIRESMIKAYMKRYPNRPDPVSPKSVYVAARKYGIPSLEAHALARIKVDMSPIVTVTELFSPFTRAYPEIRDYHLEKAVSVWSQIQKTREWTNVRKEAKEKPDAYFTELLFDIIDRFPQHS